MSNYNISITVTGNDRASGQLRGITTQVSNLKTELGSNNKGGLRGAIDGAATKMHGFFTNVDNVTTALAGFGVLKAVGDLNNIGIAADQSRVMFEALTTEIGGSAMVLERLKSATGGVVDDVTLMNGANQLLSMGIANNADELAEFVDIAISLKRPTVDAATAIDDFAKLLSNNSVLRLDNFGISSSQVKERIDELLASGEALNRSDAFQMATLEIAGDKLEALGPAADVANTSFGRLRAEVQNLVNGFGELISSGIEAGAQLIEIGNMTQGFSLFSPVAGAVSDIAQNSIDSQKPRDQFTNIQAGNMDHLIRNATLFGGSGDPNELLSQLTGGDIGDIGSLRPLEIDILNEAVERVRAEQAAQLSGYANSILNAPGVYGTTKASHLPPGFSVGMGINEQALMDPAIGQMIAEGSARTRNAGTIQSFAGFDMSALETGAKQLENFIVHEQEAQLQTMALSRAFAEVLPSAVNLATSAFDDFQQGRVDGAMSGLMTDLNDMNQIITDFGGMNEVGGITIFDPEGMDAINLELESAEDHLARIQELHDAGFVSDDALSKAQLMTTEAQSLADAAQRGADAFANMSFAELLGQTDGGQLGEFADMILENSGMGEESDAFTRLQDAFDMASGRETDLSQAVQEQFAPVIAEMSQQFGPDMAVAAAQGALAAIQDGQLAGLSQEEIIALVQSEIGFRMVDTSGEGGTLARPLFDGPGLSAGVPTMELREISDPPEDQMEQISAMETSFVTMQEAATTVSELLPNMSFTNMTEGLQEPLTAITDIKGQIEDLTSVNRQITIDVALNMPALAALIMGNGGAVPGASSQVNQNANASLIE